MDKTKIQKLMDVRTAAYNEAKSLNDAAVKEDRDLTADEQHKTDELLVKIDDMTKQIHQQERLAAAENDLNASAGTVVGLQESNASSPMRVELRKAIDGTPRAVLCTDYSEAGSRAWARYLRIGDPSNEARALQKDNDAEGGYLSAPMKFNAELIQAVDNEVFMRGLATMLPPIGNADSIGTPSLNTDAGDPTWTSELGVGSEDTSIRFGMRELKPHPLARYVKISKRLVSRSDMDTEGIVRGRMAYKIGTVMENAYLNGSGSNQPLGVMTASSNGISTSRDISAGNTETSITFDGLITAKMALKPQYRSKATWLFHTDVLLQLMKLKDGDGQYIWRPSVLAGEPDTILARPVLESTYMPHALTTGTYNGILGDFSKYWIVDALTLTVQVLTELYAMTNQNAYLFRIESDGMPVLEEAFARVKTA